MKGIFLFNYNYRIKLNILKQVNGNQFYWNISRFREFIYLQSEQQQIVEYLDEQTQLIDNTISIEEKRIELLKEYRQSLISEVVTGKRKVV